MDIRGMVPPRREPPQKFRGALGGTLRVTPWGINPGVPLGGTPQDIPPEETLGLYPWGDALWGGIPRSQKGLLENLPGC